VSFGGHAFAAGITVERDRLPEMRTRFESLVAAELDPADIAPRLEIDAALSFCECDVTLAGWLERLSPFGLGNTEPLFAATSVKVHSTQTVGGGKHVRLQLSDGTSSIEAIGFGMGERAREIAEAGRCDVAFVPSRNEWMGETRVQLKVKAVRLP
jgi:single-stranded-DNA-specific exonuclease